MCANLLGIPSGQHKPDRLIQFFGQPSQRFFDQPGTGHQAAGLNAAGSVMTQSSGLRTHFRSTQSMGVGLQSPLHGHEARHDETAAMTGLSVQEIQRDRRAAIDQTRGKHITCLQAQQAKPAIDTKLFRI